MGQKHRFSPFLPSILAKLPPILGKLLTLRFMKQVKTLTIAVFRQMEKSHSLKKTYIRKILEMVSLTRMTRLFVYSFVTRLTLN